MKTLCVDAQGLLKQAYFGAKDLYSNDQNIGGLFQFFTTIRKLLKLYNPDRVILFWDGIQSGRLKYELYSNYKANRIGKSWYSNPLELTEQEIKKELEKDKSLINQRIRIKQYSEELFFRQAEDDVTEADDCIGYYLQIKPKDEEVIIYTNDRDLCQLISDTVSIYLANKKVLITPENYFLFFKHHLSNLCLIKSIEGDASDNIKGIKGIKEKTLLNHFPQLKKEILTFDYLVEKSKLIQEERIENKQKPLKNLDNLIEGKDIYKINHKIINLKEPILTDECKEMVEEITTLQLDEENRGSKNLLKMMTEDGFINVIWNQDYVDYLTPFFNVINFEKEYLKNN